MDRKDRLEGPPLSPELLGLLVGLGTAVGAAIATPGESREALVVFVIVNSMFATLAFSVGRGLVDLLRDRSDERWRR